NPERHPFHANLLTNHAYDNEHDDLTPSHTRNPPIHGQMPGHTNSLVKFRTPLPPQPSRAPGINPFNQTISHVRRRPSTSISSQFVLFPNPRDHATTELISIALSDLPISTDLYSVTCPPPPAPTSSRSFLTWSNTVPISVNDHLRYQASEPMGPPRVFRSQEDRSSISETHNSRHASPPHRKPQRVRPNTPHHHHQTPLPFPHQDKVIPPQPLLSSISLLPPPNPNLTHLRPHSPPPLSSSHFTPHTLTVLRPPASPSSHPRPPSPAYAKCCTNQRPRSLLDQTKLNDTPTYPAQYPPAQPSRASTHLHLYRTRPSPLVPPAYSPVPFDRHSSSLTHSHPARRRTDALIRLSNSTGSSPHLAKLTLIDFEPPAVGRSIHMAGVGVELDGPTSCEDRCKLVGKSPRDGGPWCFCLAFPGGREVRGVSGVDAGYGWGGGCGCGGWWWRRWPGVMGILRRMVRICPWLRDGGV
ncbi:hypothetical protein Hypma_005182, partial [Hypsizygus marmoreus]